MVFVEIFSLVVSAVVFGVTDPEVVFMAVVFPLKLVMNFVGSVGIAVLFSLGCVFVVFANGGVEILRTVVTHVDFVVVIFPFIMVIVVPISANVVVLFSIDGVAVLSLACFAACDVLVTEALVVLLNLFRVI